jgi:predicted dinucleotide-binding enzyme
MKIGIIGSGNVGSALGKIWASNGNEIMFSSRHPENLKGLAESIGKNACYASQPRLQSTVKSWFCQFLGHRRLMPSSLPALSTARY